MYKVFLPLIILFFSHLLAASKNDSIVRLADLSLYYEWDKKVFTAYAQTRDSSNVIDLLLSPYNVEGVERFSTEKANQRIDNCVQYLQKATAEKSHSKKVKIIYNYVHKEFFKVYKLENSFSDVFKKGEYNCVSASALYAIIFSKLGVPYQIMETPQHVYLIAYPQSNKIYIETTTPDDGYHDFSEDYVKKYVNSLLISKLISKQEYDTTSLNKLFTKYYFSSTSISLLQLAGLQFSNYSIRSIKENNNDGAISYVRKAYFLYPCIRHKIVLKSLLTYEVGNNNYSDPEHVNYLETLCRYNSIGDEEISDENIKHEFLRIMETQLINNSDYEKFNSSHQLIRNALSDTVLIKEIDYYYHAELSRVGFNNAKDKEYEMKHLSAAYKINPLNVDLRGLIQSYFDRLVNKFEDSRQILDLADEFSAQFDFLNSHTLFNGLKANCILDLAYQNFLMNSTSLGEGFLKQFETLYATTKDIEIKPAFVERAYSAAAAIYYKIGNYKRSKQLLQTGLIYAPNSFGLKQRLNQF